MNGMKYESIKTTILIILVLSSIVLTWTLWTYQPEYKAIEGDNLVQEVTENVKKETSLIIKPSKILYHIDGQHFGTFSETELNRVMKEIGTWEIQDVQNITHAVQEVGLADFLSQSGHAEIFFPDPFPLQLYKSFLKINDKEHSLISFDRFVIDVNSENREEGIVYFVSTGDNLVYEARINSRLTRDFKRSFYNTAKRYPEQIEYSLSETNSVYLPKDETVVNRLDYFTDTIDIKTFIDRLFTDPDLVKGDRLSTGEVHTDGTRLLRVFNNQKYIEFINPTGMSGNQSDTTDLIQTSIDFVNEHVGWTDDYRFFSWNKESQTTVFKLYVKNIPVFDHRGLVDITQQWENNEIVKYDHPMVSLQIGLPPSPENLLKGELVMEKITSKRDFNPELLDSVTVAYELKENEDNSQFVSLQPIWSYRYNGQWGKVDVKGEDIGGREDGLE
ncbi:two-component system activity regulator YycH [Fredinandcohnia sp. QZ13]|uniref:YycH family regulatory protein n=1 Tax=Fredinandcohnia sp. QZ13 TaxID=3073144 RepID=UPI0028530841|nr:two-component system activity regulator YycH [Fredinandcohnia sp. QZ13]MDR4890471.1 two-component system activity regulator YycH [Fredinandcohnia sp. QZ13]